MDVIENSKFLPLYPIFEYSSNEPTLFKKIFLKNVCAWLDIWLYSDIIDYIWLKIKWNYQGWNIN